MLVRKTCVFIVFHARPPLVFSIQGDQVPMVVYTSAIFSCNDMVLALQWLYYTSACVPPNPRHSIPAYTALWQQCPPPPAPCACSSTGVTGRGRRMPRGGVTARAHARCGTHVHPWKLATPCTRPHRYPRLRYARARPASNLQQPLKGEGRRGRSAAAGCLALLCCFCVALTLPRPPAGAAATT